MIKNGFYSYGSKALDGVDGGDSGVMVLRDGGILGGTSFFYFIGTYSCSGGRWKGEITHQEHNPAPQNSLPDGGTDRHRRVCRNVYRRGCRIRSHGARRQAKPSVPRRLAAAADGGLSGL